MEIVLFNEKDECCGCSACASACPTKAITMVTDDEGFLYPSIDKSTCVKCGKCLKICPMKDEV